MSNLSRLLLLILFFSISSLMSWAQESADPYVDVPKSRAADGGFILGDPEAGIKLIEFSDFLCANCQNYEPIISGFIWDYVVTGRAQFEYRIFPVIDPDLSVQSASLVECAETLMPGSFWRAHDQMFDMVSKQGFTAQSYSQFADLLNLDAEALRDCAATAGQHAQDAAYGLSLGARGTPSLFVQYGDAVPVQIALPLAEHFPSIVNAIRPKSMDPVTIELGDYAGLTTFRRVDGGIVLGDPKAPMSIVAFEDFLCPHCQSYTETVKRFIHEQVRDGNAQFEYRFYPLVNPQYSTTFARIAECVAVQDLRLFWDAHDLLFEFAGTGNLTDVPAKLAGLLGLDGDSLNACLERAMQFLVDTQLGQSASVAGTPAVRARDAQGELQIIYAGGRPQDRGGLPLEMLTALVDGAPGLSIGPPERSLLNDSFLKDSSLIDGEPCAPPCWNNITPGETDMATALELLASTENLHIVQAVDSGFLFQSGDGEPCCQVTSRDDGTVASILLQFAPETGLGDLLSVHGEPMYVTGQSFSDKEALIVLYYPERRMLLYVVVPGVDGQLEASSPVVSAIYATEDLLTDAFGATPFDHWKGYLTYSEYMDGKYDYQP
ncbi:MAG: thioredoxin domain-containing protein [Chloroflexi bacterium]|nr:thioredoxin domain-containing protein [Chloroflexota bacterium]